MSRIRTLLTVLATVATAGALVAQTSVANACEEGDVNVGSSPLDKNLAFVDHYWHTGDNPDSGGVHVRAPRGFEMTRTATGQGRFNDTTRTWLLTVDARGEGYVADLMRARERELAGLRDLKIVKDGVTVDAEGQRLATVIYRYTNAAGEARLVQTRYVASMPHAGGRNTAFAELTVAGRPQDRAGLNAVLRTATRSVYLAG